MGVKRRGGKKTGGKKSGGKKTGVKSRVTVFTTSCGTFMILHNNWVAGLVLLLECSRCLKVQKERRIPAWS